MADILLVESLIGRWEGWYYRTLTREWRPSAHRVQQHEQDIVVDAWGPDTWSHSVSAKILPVHTDGTFEFIWSYQAESTKKDPQAGYSHMGTHFFRFFEEGGRKHLDGKYITDQFRHKDGSIGTGGFHRLTWVSSDMKSGCEYKPGGWGLIKPEMPPDEVQALFEQVRQSLEMSPTLVSSADVPVVFAALDETVRRQIQRILPGLADALNSINDNLRSTNSYDWSNAVHNCRRMLEQLADALFPPRNEERLNRRTGKTIKIGRQEWKNRLGCFIEDNVDPPKGALVAAELEFLWDRLDAVHNVANKGTHTILRDRELANRYVAHTYILIADILALTG